MNKHRSGKRQDDPAVKISKKLSYILRHGAVEEGLEIGQDGYVLLADILKRHDFKGITIKTIEEIVENNDKQRFQIITKVDQDGLNGKYIRATQGHSIKQVDDDDLLTPITVDDVGKYPIVVHGTYKKGWDIIKVSGLSPMQRNHVHFAIGYPQSEQVISGMRNTCEIFIEVNLEKSIKAGMKWYISKNKVLLSPGINRIISPLFFKRVVDVQGKVVFDGIDENWQELEGTEQEEEKKQNEENQEQIQKQKQFKEQSGKNISDNWEQV